MVFQARLLWHDSRHGATRPSVWGAFTLRVMLIRPGELLQMVRKPDNPDGDEIYRHHVVQNARHQQDEDTRNQGDEWVQQNWVHGWQMFLPVKGR